MKNENLSEKMSGARLCGVCMFILCLWLSSHTCALAVRVLSLWKAADLSRMVPAFCPTAAPEKVNG